MPAATPKVSKRVASLAAARRAVRASATISVARASTPKMPMVDRISI